MFYYLFSTNLPDLLFIILYLIRKWIDDIKEWSKLNQSDLMVKPHDRNEWRRHCLTASSLISATIPESRE